MKKTLSCLATVLLTAYLFAQSIVLHPPFVDDGLWNVSVTTIKRLGFKGVRAEYNASEIWFRYGIDLKTGLTGIIGNWGTTILTRVNNETAFLALRRFTLRDNPAWTPEENLRCHFQTIDFLTSKGKWEFILDNEFNGWSRLDATATKAHSAHWRAVADYCEAKGVKWWGPTFHGDFEGATIQEEMRRRILRYQWVKPFYPWIPEEKWSWNSYIDPRWGPADSSAIFVLLPFKVKYISECGDRFALMPGEWKTLSESKREEFGRRAAQQVKVLMQAGIDVTLYDLNDDSRGFSFVYGLEVDEARVRGWQKVMGIR